MQTLGPILDLMNQKLYFNKIPANSFRHQSLRSSTSVSLLFHCCLSFTKQISTQSKVQFQATHASQTSHTHLGRTALKQTWLPHASWVRALWFLQYSGIRRHRHPHTFPSFASGQANGPQIHLFYDNKGNKHEKFIGNKYASFFLCHLTVQTPGGI